MRSIFKLYIFKLVILSITMIFISFGASAYNSDIGSMYGWCSVLKKNNFSFKGLDTEEFVEALVCESAMQSYVQVGANTCDNIKIAHFASKRVAKNDQSKIKVFLDGIAIDTANSFVSTKQVILSFLNYAEKNPNEFNDRLYIKRQEFLGKVFPCKLDE